jgi:Sulfotransferase domain
LTDHIETRAQRVMPDFVIIGGSKCGTVWMNECLREHPEVFMSPDVHEIFFFDRYFDRGVEWYAHYFRGYRHEKRVGEQTSEYLANPLVPARLHSVLPDATLIVSLRNPVQRAWSKYLDLWRKGGIAPKLGFWGACEVAPGILADGEYFARLRPWRELFPPERLHLLVLDDAAADPYAFMRRVYELLGVDPSFRAAATARRVNEHRTPRVPRIAKVAYGWSHWMHRHRLHAPVDIAKRLGLPSLVLHRGREAGREPPPLSAADRVRLSAHYRDDVGALSDVMGRDLVSLWLAHDSVTETDSVAVGGA